MLVLTRKLMEKVYIGQNICITVVRLEGGQVRLGIDAPREISVVRAELFEDEEDVELVDDDEAQPPRPRRPRPRNPAPVTVTEGLHRRASGG